MTAAGKTPAKKVVAKKVPAKKVAASPMGGKDKLSKQELESEYGYTAALIKSSGELSKLFQNAYDGQWTAQRFQAALKNTGWYQNHADTWRQTEALRLQDKQTYNSNVAQTTTHLRNIATQIGARLGAAQSITLATQYYRAGYTDEQMQQALRQYITPNAQGVTGGAAGQSANKLRALAEANGVSMNDSWYTSAASAVGSGLGDQASYEDFIRKTAASQYAPYAKQIMAGTNVKDIASAYTNQMASTLEMNPMDVKLTDPTIQKALKGIDKEGNPSVQSLWDFDQQLKADPRWAKTKNAMDATSSTALGVLRGMGFGV